MKIRLMLCLVLIATGTILLADNLVQNHIRRSELGFSNNYNNEVGETGNLRRNEIPPSNLTAEVIDQINVRLNWEEPTELVKLHYHDGVPVDAFFQISANAYGTVFDLTDYPGATLQYLDFRHSPWGINGTWAYEVLIIDWSDRSLIARVQELSTTLNNGWEREVFLDSLQSVSEIGIFIVPLGNQSNDAYPVIDFDGQLSGESFVINATNYTTVETSDGDFLIDLWIRPDMPVSRNKAEENELVLVKRNQLVRDNNRDLTGYKIYRNDAEISHITNPATLTYLDEGLQDGVFTYFVTAVYDEGESDPSNSVEVTINSSLQLLWSDNFDAYPDFGGNFEPWITIDLDGSATYGFNNTSFPGEYQPASFIVFNPESTTPPLTTLTAQSGTKVAACFASTTPSNNDWLISPPITLGTESKLAFFARSYTTQYGADRFRVLISTTEPEIEEFMLLSEGDYVEAPISWTEFEYNISEHDGRTVYFAINAVSNDSFLLLMDNFRIYSIGGSNVDKAELAANKLLISNYPNPFNPETTISFSLAVDADTELAIYNLKGQKVRTMISERLAQGEHKVVWNGKDEAGYPVGSGVYFYRLSSDDTIRTNKMLLLK